MVKEGTGKPLPSMENGAVARRVAADPPPSPLERGGGANPTPRADIVEWAPRPKERPANAAAPTPRPRVWLGAVVAAAPKVPDVDPFFLRDATANIEKICCGITYQHLALNPNT
jgi:hypothetical protein